MKNIEVKKHALRQNQEGQWMITLAVHPNDMPTALLHDPMGTRYYLDVRNAELADQEEEQAG